MPPRETRAIALTLVVAIILYTSIAFIGTTVFWGCMIALGALVTGLLASRRSQSRPGALSGGFLCDGCKYDDQRYCSRPERPNARQCPDYKPRS
ncbi:MAG: hypothetical protein CMJ90_13465 [Planctomycetes bacterium]|nr:hypothetical protein [Planctomycetota bacterium]